MPVLVFMAQSIKNPLYNLISDIAPDSGELGNLIPLNLRFSCIKFEVLKLWFHPYLSQFGDLEFYAVEFEKSYIFDLMQKFFKTSNSSELILKIAYIYQKIKHVFPLKAMNVLIVLLLLPNFHMRAFAVQVVLD